MNRFEANEYDKIILKEDIFIIMIDRIRNHDRVLSNVSQIVIWRFVCRGSYSDKEKSVFQKNILFCILF